MEPTPTQGRRKNHTRQEDLDKQGRHHHHAPPQERSGREGQRPTPGAHHALPPETTRGHKEELRSLRSTDPQTPSPQRNRHREANTLQHQQDQVNLSHISLITVSNRSSHRKENVTEQRSHGIPDTRRGEWRPSSSPPKPTTHTPDLHQEPPDLKRRHLDEI